MSKYTITVLYVNSPQQIIQYHTISVENGEIIEESAACSEQEPQCSIREIDLNNVTIPGLFGMTRSALINGEITDNGTEFNFDPT